MDDLGNCPTTKTAPDIDLDEMRVIFRIKQKNRSPVDFSNFGRSDLLAFADIAASPDMTKLATRLQGFAHKWGPWAGAWPFERDYDQSMRYWVHPAGNLWLALVILDAVKKQAYGKIDELLKQSYCSAKDQTTVAFNRMAAHRKYGLFLTEDFDGMRDHEWIIPGKQSRRSVAEHVVRQQTNGSMEDTIIPRISEQGKIELCAKSPHGAAALALAQIINVNADPFLICEQCGKWFHGRENALTCSTSCRVLKSRRLKKEQATPEKRTKP